MPRCPTCHRRLIHGGVCPGDGAAPTPLPVDPNPPTAPTVSGYRITEHLGGGGFAHVWEGAPDDGDNPVAIKVGHTGTGISRARFAREADALRRIGPPHVPALLHHGHLPNDRPYLIMERLYGESLADHLGLLPSAPPLDWVRQVGDAVLACLEAVHACGLVHRDLTPNNIFLYEQPEIAIKLIDFGITRPVGPGDGPDLTIAGTMLGTAEYMAPEQFKGDRGLDTRADIYSVGILLYEMLTLRVPFSGDLSVVERGHRSMRPRPPREFGPVPEPLENLCLGCLAKNPELRPPNVSSLRYMFANACQDASQTTTTTAVRRTRGTPLLTAAHEPVVLLVVDVPPGDQRAIGVLTRRKGIIARQRGRRLVCGFTGFLDEDPGQAAVAAARELAESRGARIGLHLAQVKVRRGRDRRAPKLYGAAIEDVDAWLPDGEWTGIQLTRALARALPASQTHPSRHHDGFYDLAAIELAPTVTEPALVGRDSTMALASASLRATLDTRTPGLFTLYGDSGLGKSRIARELVKLARRIDPDARVLSLRASRQALGRRHETVHRLLGLLEPGRDPDPTADDIVESRSATQRAHDLGTRLRAAAHQTPVAVILDDAHYADGAALDALEYASLDGDDIALWVAVIAHPRLEERRPRWGQRAHRYADARLEPLDEDATMSLAAALLHPAEYPPAAALRRMAQWTGGSPHLLSELVRTLKREGIVRRRAHGNTWYVATAELDRLPTSPAEQWVASRQLDALPPEQAALIRMCAVLGVEFLRDELEWVQNAADRSGTAGTSLDTDVGLAELERGEILTDGADGVWSFPQAAFQDAVYKLIGDRDRHEIHRHALGFWHAQAGRSGRPPDRVLTAIGRHAGASGEIAIAASAYLTLAERARTQFRDVDADQLYTTALAYTEEDEHALRVQILGGRGRVRYRIQRIDEAIADLQAAREHAEVAGDNRAIADLLLEEATALDWAQLYEDSARRVEDARNLVRHSKQPTLEARYAIALGRCHYRREDMAEAVPHLERGASIAARHDDPPTEIIGHMLLGVALVKLERLDESEAHFNRAIELCEQIGDRLHQCAAYGNRAYLWSARQQVSHIMEDLRHVIVLAREYGLPIAERVAAHNLAEFLHRSGNSSSALVLAKRAYTLQRHVHEIVATDALLLARIHAARDELHRAQELVGEVHHLRESHTVNQLDQLMLRMLDIYIADRSQDPTAQGRVTRRDWDALVRDARSIPVVESLEILYFRARAAIRAKRWPEASVILAHARSKLSAHPIWESAFDDLAKSLPHS